MIKNLPKIMYDLAIRNENAIPVIIPDILVRINYRMTDIENRYMFFNYTMLDGETPEIISYKFYNTMDYHWVVMYINNRFDYITDFPMIYDSMMKFVISKYGEDKIYDIHHYEDPDGNVVDEYYYDYKNATNAQLKGLDATHPIWMSDYKTLEGIPVTNYEYEDGLNERKRQIKLIKSNYIGEFIKAYLKALKESTT